MMLKKRKDEEKAFSLVETSEITLQRLEKTGVLEFPTNSLIDYYSIIHSLCEAVAYLKGYKFKGESAHKELIEFVLKGHGSIELIQEMRTLRNRALYDGKKIKEEYIKINKKEIKETIQFLKELIKRIK